MQHVCTFVSLHQRPTRDLISYKALLAVLYTSARQGTMLLGNSDTNYLVFLEPCALSCVPISHGLRYMYTLMYTCTIIVRTCIFSCMCIQYVSAIKYNMLDACTYTCT